MQKKTKYTISFFLLSGVLLVAAMLLAFPNTANAQCGSQASSCKNCHEVQGQDPVNNDGTGWHTGHAFGDFCYLCHAGNNQSMDKAEAHASMVPPLSDVQAACQGCHPGDLMERAQVYATALGVEIGTGSSGTGGSVSPSDPNTEGETTSSPEEAQPAEVAISLPEEEVIDYNQIYAESVLGERTINWGNLLMGAMILLILVAGGFFVYTNERKLRGLPPLPVASQSKSSTGESTKLPEIDGYPSEIVALLPQIAKLNPLGLHALRIILEDPEQASEMLHSLSRLDAELLRRIRNLDKDSRALLLALAGD